MLRKILFGYAVAYLAKHGWDTSEVEGLVASACGLASVVWSHYVHAPSPDTKPTPSGISVVPLLLAGLLWSGCAVTRPFAESTTTTTNGVVTHRLIKSTSFAFWPATQTLGKENISSGEKLGINESGLRQESGSTNVVEALRALDSILGKVKP